MPGTDVLVVDPVTAEPMALGEPGEIILRSPSITTGYWRNPEATARQLRDGWLHTGDTGYLDDDGFLYLTDRKAFMIISGGVNIYPQEAENVLINHPAVYDVAVIGVWDVSSSVHNDVGQLCADGVTLVLVDVSGVSRVTPSGMADLMNAVRSARRHRADLRIFGHSPAVADALDALGLGEILVLYPDRNAALIRERRVLDARSRGPRPMRTEMRPRSVGSN